MFPQGLTLSAHAHARPKIGLGPEGTCRNAVWVWDWGERRLRYCFHQDLLCEGLFRKKPSYGRETAQHFEKPLLKMFIMLPWRISGNNFILPESGAINCVL